MLDKCKAHGAVNHAVVEFYKCDIHPMYSAADHIHDDCSHSIDTLRWICGGEVVKVDSCFKRIGTPDINWVQSTLQFDNGATGHQQLGQWPPRLPHGDPLPRRIC